MKYSLRSAESTINIAQKYVCIFTAIKLLDFFAIINSPNGNVYRYPKDIPCSQKYKDEFSIIVNGYNIRKSHIYVKYTLKSLHTVNNLKVGDKHIMKILNYNKVWLQSNKMSTHRKAYIRWLKVINTIVNL